MGKKSAEMDPIKELGTAIVAELERRRDTGCAAFERLNDLARSIRPAVSDVDILAASVSAPLKSRVIPSFTNEPDAYVCLKEDKHQLAASELLLRELLMRNCSPNFPHFSVDSMQRLLNPALSASFKKHWDKHVKERRLPGFVGIAMVHTNKPGKPRPELHDLRFPLPWIDLSKRMLHELRTMREQPGTTYPPTLEQLSKQCGLPADDDLVRRALTSEPFASHVMPVIGKELVDGIGLSDDPKRLASDERLARRLIQEETSPQRPLITMGQLSSKLAVPLRKHFVAHWSGRIQHDNLPQFVAYIPQSGKSGAASGPPGYFHDVRFPLPWIELSQRLVNGLEQWAGALPTVQQLVERIQPPPKPEHVQRACETDFYKSQVAFVFPRQPTGPVFLLSQADTVGLRPELIRPVLEASLTLKNRLAKAEALPRAGSLHPTLIAPFKSGLAARIAQNQLPVGLGAILHGVWQLFLLNDVRQGASPTPSKAAPLPTA